LFGWNDMLHMDMGPMGTYLIFGHNGMQLGGMFDKGRLGQPGPAYWVGYVRVPNVESAIEHAKAAGGSLLNGPMDVPGGDRVAQLADPQGALFALHTVAVDVRAAAPKKAAKKAAKKKAAKRKTGKKKTAKKKPTTKTARARKKVGKKTPKKTPRKAAKKQRKKAAARASKEPASRAKRRKLKTRR
jgi:predicted enzyme related to lactoylglutathione lyase